MKRIILALSLLIIAACAQQTTQQTYNTSCVTNTTVVEVRGTSLSGVIEPGATMKVLEGYAQCNNLMRGDIVTYRYAGNANPLLKEVKAIPGDKWYLDGCNIIVNNKTLVNSAGTPYCIDDTRRLQLYVNDYPTIPADTYLLMGNQPGGTLDASVFGLVDKQDIIGKAELQQ